MTIIEIKNLSHCFPDGSLGLDNVSLTIQKGEFVIITGENGSGKTTLLRHLNGLLSPDKGEALVAGVSVRENPIRARRLVGMVFQDADSQIVGETVFEEIAFGPENLRLEKEEIDRRVLDALNITGLAGLAEKRPHLLSGGEKRRLAIAGILAMEPEIILFDEPFSNLDYPGTIQVTEQIRALQKMGRTIIITTHDPEKMASHADLLVIMQQGKIIELFKPGMAPTDMRKFGVNFSGAFF